MNLKQIKSTAQNIELRVMYWHIGITDYLYDRNWIMKKNKKSSDPDEKIK